MKSNPAILSTAYFAPIQYFAKLVLHNKIVIEQHENYTKQSYRNRCNIYGANGKLTLSIPIKKNHNQKTRTKNIEISYDTNWIKNHLKTIESAYRSAPFYEYYTDNIFELIKSNSKYLFDFNLKVLYKMLEILEIETSIEFTNEYEEDVLIADYRDTIHPKLNYDEFDKNFNLKPYYQVFSDKHGFIPNLSILDLIFNTGPEAKSILGGCF